MTSANSHLSLNSLASTAGDDLIEITAADLISTVTLDGAGGTDTLQLNGGGAFDLGVPADFKNIEIIRGSTSDDTIKITTNRFVGVGSIEGGGGTDRLLLSGQNVDLRGKDVTGFAEIQVASIGGASITVNDKGLASLIKIGNQFSSTDTLTIAGTTLSNAEKKVIFDHGIDTIIDAGGTSVNHAPQVANLVGEIRTSGGNVAGNIVHLDVGGDATVTDDDATLSRLQVYTSSFGATGGSLGIDTSGAVSLSNGMAFGSKITVAGTEIGEIVAILTTGDEMLQINFNGNDTHGLVEQLIHALTYTNSSADASLVEQRTITIALSDIGDRTSKSVAYLTVAPSSGFVLTQGADSFTGTGAADVFYGHNTTLNGNDVINGGAGDDTLQLLFNNGIDSIVDLTSSITLSSIEIIRGTTGKDIIDIDAAHLAGVSTIDGGGGFGDDLYLIGDIFDLRGKTISNITAIALTNEGGTHVTLSDTATALRIFGRDTANDHITLKGGVFTAAQRQTLNDNGIDIITDDNTTSTNTAPRVTGLDGDRVLTSAGATVFLDVGRNAVITEDDNALFMISATITAGKDANDRVGIDTSGSVKLSNGVTHNSKVTVNGTEIGTIFIPDDGGINVVISNGAPLALMQELVRAFTYSNVGPAVPLTSREVTITFTDPGHRESKSVVTIEQQTLAGNTKPSSIDLSQMTVKEAALAGTQVGVLKAIDADQGDIFSFSLVNPDGRFKIEGDRLIVADGTKLDYEQAKSHVVTVRVTDKGGLSVDRSFTIALIDEVAEKLLGTIAADKFVGGGGKDALSGAEGNDTLSGGLGNDILTGGSGRDIFVFDTKLNKKSNVDKITDFNVAEDTIHLAKSIFSKIAKKGVLVKSAFWTGHDAKDASDRIGYDKKSGALFYDSDGNGAHAAVQIATLQKKLTTISNKDFFVM